MGTKGTIRYLLTGSYTRQGYYSFVPDLLRGLDRVWILKGQPGTGKSSFIRALGENLAGRGYEIEFWLSGIEPGSAEGLFLPQLNAAVVNGSMPQPMDPPIPGVKSESIDFDGFYKGVRSEEQYQELVAWAARILHHHRQVENMIENAAYLDACQREARSVYIDQVWLDRVVKDVENLLFRRPRQDRHFYACSLTVDGLMDYIHEISRSCRSRIVFTGPVGCGQDRVLMDIAAQAQARGMALEYYHWALDADKTCLLIIEDLRVALIDNTLLNIEKRPGDVIIDMSTTLERPAFEVYNHSGDCQKLESLILQVQGELEEVYRALKGIKRSHSAGMDFSQIDMQREVIERQIIQR